MDRQTPAPLRRDSAPAGASLPPEGRSRAAHGSPRNRRCAAGDRGLFKEVRAARRHHEHAAHPIIGWFDPAVGILLLFETFHGVHHKPFYFRAPFAAAVVTFGM